MKKLIERLRDYTYAGDSWVTQQEAADEIERLTAEKMNLAADIVEIATLRDKLLGDRNAEIERLTAELGDLPESQREMMAEIKQLKAYAAKADIELDNLEDKLREAHAMSATLSHAARVSHRWEQAEIDKFKARVRAALEEPQ